MFDVIIVGSGPAGVHAAYPLVEAGLRVAMVDGGHEAAEAFQDPPPINFDEMRASRSDQHRWFLGEDFSGIPLDPLGIGRRGSIVSGPRQYVTEGTEKFLPVRSDGVELIQTLAKGGLGAVWGGVCAFYPPTDLEAMGLPAAEMERHYDIVVNRVGVSGPEIRQHIQPSCRPDSHAERMLRTYQRRKQSFDAMDVAVSQPHLALLTQDMGSRKATAYQGMEYWHDYGRSLYRPQYTLESLQSHANFSYIGRRLVQKIEEGLDGCVVHSVPIPDSRLSEKTEETSLHGRRVILAAGAVGTARILLRSLGLYDRDVPFLAKSHRLTACLDPRSLGSVGQKEWVSLCQLVVTDERKKNGKDSSSAGYAQLYSYKSLGLVRLLGFLPLPVPEALGILALLTPSLVIADIRFPVHHNPENTLRLHRDAEGQEIIQIKSEEGSYESKSNGDSLKRLRKALRRLGLIPLRSKTLPPGSTAHYAGTVPISSSPKSFPLSVDSTGKLHQGRQIYVADSSTFQCIPAKSICMTIMANANRVGENVRNSLSKD